MRTLPKGAPTTDSIKYRGMDVHKESISIAVMNGTGKLVMESIIATKAITVVQFIQGLRGDLYVLQADFWTTSRPASGVSWYSTGR